MNHLKISFKKSKVIKCCDYDLCNDKIKSNDTQYSIDLKLPVLPILTTSKKSRLIINYLMKNRTQLIIADLRNISIYISFVIYFNYLIIKY
jgi:hypothetical protein